MLPSSRLQRVRTDTGTRRPPPTDWRGSDLWRRLTRHILRFARGNCVTSQWQPLRRPDVNVFTDLIEWRFWQSNRALWLSLIAKNHIEFSAIFWLRLTFTINSCDVIITLDCKTVAFYDWINFRTIITKRANFLFYQISREKISFDSPSLLSIINARLFLNTYSWTATKSDKSVMSLPVASV